MLWLSYYCYNLILRWKHLLALSMFFNINWKNIQVNKNKYIFIYIGKICNLQQIIYLNFLWEFCILVKTVTPPVMSDLDSPPHPPECLTPTYLLLSSPPTVEWDFWRGKKCLYNDKVDNHMIVLISILGTRLPRSQ